MRCPIQHCPSEFVRFFKHYVCIERYQTASGVQFHLETHHHWPQSEINSWCLEQNSLMEGFMKEWEIKMGEKFDRQRLEQTGGFPR